ncbi:MAG: methionyl-tRNA formyltransferase [Eubacteriales bacterium]
MRILFMGTPDFARSVLQSLCEDGEDIAAVVTQTDKPKGRKMLPAPPPVKEYALSRGLPVYQPATLRDGAFADTLAQLAPELIVVVAYGKILPGYILDYPKYGCINVHASLLPRWRGAAPIQRAIMAGDAVSGVTIQYMAAGIDTGDMLCKIETPITEEMDYGMLHDQLAADGCQALRQALAAIRSGTVIREAQNDFLATYASKIENADCALDFSRPLADVHNRIRGLSPMPLAIAQMPDGRRLKIAAAQRTNERTDAAPGTVISMNKSGIRVACADGVLLITEVQPEGKKRMRAADFANGRAIAAGDVLETPCL